MFETLLSIAVILPALWLVYTIRAWWVARTQWSNLTPDTKGFYLMVAPPLAFALDLFLLSDRLFYWPQLAGSSRNVAAAIVALCVVADPAVALNISAG